MKYLDKYSAFLEGARIEADGKVHLSRSDNRLDILGFVNGKTRVLTAGGYTVHYRLESKPGVTHHGLIKKTMDGLKSANSEKFSDAFTSLTEFMRPDLKDLQKSARTSGTFDYIVKIGSSEGLANAMAEVAKRQFPKAKVIDIPKLIHSSFYTAIDFKELERSLLNYKISSFQLVKDFIYSQIDKDQTGEELVTEFKRTKGPSDLAEFLKSDSETGQIVWKERYRNFKVKKTGTIPGNIIKYFVKYDLATTEFLEMISSCIREKKNAIIFDDNIHNKTDIKKIFETVERQATNVLETIKTAEYVGGGIKGLYDNLAANYRNRFIAYVLYRMKDSDLPEKTNDDELKQTQTTDL